MISKVFLVLVSNGVSTYPYLEHKEWKRAAAVLPEREIGVGVARVVA